jgi:hypothetical protein
MVAESLTRSNRIGTAFNREEPVHHQAEEFEAICASNTYTLTFTNWQIVPKKLFIIDTAKRIENPRVGGSIPPLGTIIFNKLEWNDLLG